MHEELKGLESVDGSRSAMRGSRPSPPKVSAANDDVVMRLRSALGARPAPITGNVARRAAISAMALAKQPIRHARITSAAWLPLLVPSRAAGWPASPPQRAPGSRQSADAAPEVAEPALLRQSSPVARVAEGAAGCAAGSDTSRAFSFRPGDRVLRFSGGCVADVATEPAVHTPMRRDGVGPGSARAPIGVYAGKAARWIGIAFAAWFGLMFFLILLFRFVDPPGSTLILWQALTGTKIEQRWVPLSRISSNLRRAVVVSEDGRFCQHWGVDPREVLAAIRRARDGVPRGASTITMQVAKNLFLWPSKSYLRKALEVPLAFLLDLLWPKWRIMEVYLNIAEWGPGVFGAEAASQHHFRKPASRLSRREAALLAVALPNPIERRAGKPGPGTARLASLIRSRVRVSGDAAACVLRSR